ncbi:DUF6624 domain-containing protein [Oxalobacteraceae bacterium A2-2]
MLARTILGPLFLLLLTTLANTAALAQSTPQEPGLREELLAMMAEDQRTLDLETSDPQAFEAIQPRFQQRIQGIIAQYGWPGISLVGKDGATAAWLLVQHRDADRPYQLQVLELMAPLVKQGEVSGANYAYLYDRTHRPQLYGTQGRCVREGKGGWEPFVVEDLPKLDQRRREMGLGPIADYADRFGCSAAAVAFLAGAGPTVAVPKN